MTFLLIQLNTANEIRNENFLTQNGQWVMADELSDSGMQFIRDMLTVTWIMMQKTTPSSLYFIS